MKRLVPFPNQQESFSHIESNCQLQSIKGHDSKRFQEFERGKELEEPSFHGGTDKDTLMPSLNNFGKIDSIDRVQEHERLHSLQVNKEKAQPQQPLDQDVLVNQNQQNDREAKDSEHDPNFVSNFFKQSRLHFIGSWRLRHKDIIRKLFQNKSSHLKTDRQKDRGSSAGVIIRKILHIDMDCFFAAVAIREEPQLQGKAIAICHANIPQAQKSSITMLSSTSEISAASYAARECGIRAGMFLGHALRLCPQLIVRHYRFDLYESITTTLFTLLMDYSDIIEPVSCDEVYMDISDVSDYMHTNNETLLMKIKQRIFKETGCVASIGMGSNKLLAKIASKVFLHI